MNRVVNALMAAYAEPITQRVVISDAASNYSGFDLNGTDPFTGVQENVGVCYDHLFGVPASSEVGSQSFAERFIRLAQERGAIATLWEEHTAAIQTKYGNPQAGLTEFERVGRNGLLATQVTGHTRFWRLVALESSGFTPKSIAFCDQDMGDIDGFYSRDVPMADGELLGVVAHVMQAANQGIWRKFA